MKQLNIYKIISVVLMICIAFQIHIYGYSIWSVMIGYAIGVLVSKTSEKRYYDHL